MPNFRNTLTGQILRSRAFAAVFVSIAAFFFLISVVSNASARGNIQHNSYLSLATLNNEMKTSNYFHAGTSTNNTNAEGAQTVGIDNFVTVNDGQNTNDTNVRWHLKVHNGMQNAEYVMIKAKLLNSTQSIPDDLTNQPSAEQPIFQTSTIIPSDSDQLIPFEWKITNVSQSNDGHLTISQMMINGKIIDNIKTASSNSNNFRFIFELWRYDNNSGEFQYSWSSAEDSPGIKRSVWNQIWFSVMN